MDLFRLETMPVAAVPDPVVRIFTDDLHGLYFPDEMIKKTCVRFSIA